MEDFKDQKEIGYGSYGVVRVTSRGLSSSRHQR